MIFVLSRVLKTMLTLHFCHLFHVPPPFLFQNLSLAAGGCRSNLRKQIQIAHLFGVPVVVAVNVFK